jgi:hypothetical protein
LIHIPGTPICFDQLWYSNGWFIRPGPKHWKPDDPWTVELLGLKNFMVFVANDLCRVLLGLIKIYI